MVDKKQYEGKLDVTGADVTMVSLENAARYPNSPELHSCGTLQIIVSYYLQDQLRQDLEDNGITPEILPVQGEKEKSAFLIPDTSANRTILTDDFGVEISTRQSTVGAELRSMIKAAIRSREAERN